MLQFKQFKICRTTGVHINKNDQDTISRNISVFAQENDEEKHSSSKKLSISDSSEVTVNNKTEQGSIRFSLVRESNTEKSRKPRKVQIKNLDNIKVQYKKIQDFEQEKRKRREAKQFIDRMQKDKSEFQGKLLLIKQKQQKKKQLQLIKLKAVEQYEENEKMKRREEAQQRVQVILSRILERKKISKSKNQSKSKSPNQNQSNHESSQDAKFKEQKKGIEDRKSTKKSLIVPINKMKKKRQKETKKLEKRAKTISTDSTYLDKQQKRQIKLIRQKISLLTRKLRQC